MPADRQAEGREVVAPSPGDSSFFESERWFWWKRALYRARLDLILSISGIAVILIGRFVFDVWVWPMWVVLLITMAQVVFAVPLAGKQNDRDDLRKARDLRAEQSEAEFRDRYNPERWPDDTESSD